MKYFLLLFIPLCLTPTKALAQQIDKIIIAKQDINIFYDKPASTWTEAIPLGNGYMGAMLFGDPNKEHLQLNEGTLYSGEPSKTFKNIDVRKQYKQVTELLKNHKYQEAQAIIGKEWLGRNHQLYEPLGDFWIDFDHQEGVITDYKRALDLGSATASVKYKVGNTTYKREYFASYPHHIIVIKVTAEGPGKINCKLRLSTPHTPNAHFFTQANRLTMQGKAPEYGVRRTLEAIEKAGDTYKYPELFNKNAERKAEATHLMYGQGGMAFETTVKAMQTGGKLSAEADKIVVQNAKEAIFILTAATSFNGFDKSPSTEGINPNLRIQHYFKVIANKSYADLYKSHLTDYQSLFNRTQLSLETATEQSKLPTDKRIEMFANGQDPSFAALYFQFGRYLMIAGSRANGQPLNLQGIWNDQLIPPWNGAYTININAQMNYWPAELTNLAECQAPLFKAVKELAINGKQTAQNMYGNTGWVAHHNMDIWRHAEPIDICNCAFWNMAGGWLTSHFWEHYLFSGDKVFLKNEVFPLLKGVVQFYDGWLVTNEQGYLVTPVGHSPEHNFVYESGKQATFSPGPTMDMAIVREAYTRYLEACKLLDIDDPFTENIRLHLTKLLPYQIGKYGQLQEWQEDFEDGEKEHRHVSHLYAIHPSNQINHQTTPELVSAVKKSMERRGDAATGWSMGWKVNIWARLLDGDHALKLLTNLFKLVRETGTNMRGGGTYPNLFDAHPPFQIDGNFGATAGIAELLVQSHAGEIYLLPALPKAWSAGKVKGLKARGGFEIDMEWQAGKLTKAIVYSTLGGNCRIRTNQKILVQTVNTQPAKGENPNTLFRFIDPQAPLIKDKTKLEELQVPNSFVIDFDTHKAKQYLILDAL